MNETYEAIRALPLDARIALMILIASFIAGAVDLIVTRTVYKVVLWAFGFSLGWLLAELFL